MSSALVWFRRDLRADDHTALHHAMTEHEQVWCVFVIDPADPARPVASGAVDFVRAALIALDRRLARDGGGLILCQGTTCEVLARLAQRLQVQQVVANRDYGPAAQALENAVARTLATVGVRWCSYKDQVIFEHTEISTQAGTPFSVFTPYKNAWLRRLDEHAVHALRLADCTTRRDRLAPPPHDLQHASILVENHPAGEVLALGRGAGSALPQDSAAAGTSAGTAAALTRLDDFLQRIDRYRELRDFPALAGTSGLSTDLRYGTVSIRHLVRAACARRSAGAETWLAELIWREFFFMILAEHPRVVEGAFHRQYDRLSFVNDPLHWSAWCAGATGYPIVDAAMRQINSTGFMHNRLRMIVASFLVKDLGIDWRTGARYFATHLTDYDLAANNGGWQWAASTGCDAQPYFRIFNPVRQSLKFDPNGQFIRRFLPELAAVPDQWIHAPWLMPAADQAASKCVIGRDYPAPIIDHAEARLQTLARFAAARA